MREAVATKRVILYAQFDVDENADIPMRYRPALMARGFEDLGYEVYWVSGSKRQRKESIRRIKNAVRSGQKFEFMYAETALRPMFLPVEGDRTRITPFLDSAFFRFCKSQRIPIGLFYRDIFWRYPDAMRHRSQFGVRVIGAFYQMEMSVYRRSVTRLFLPSMNMAENFPEDLAKKAEALPPGCVERPLHENSSGSDLRLFYVGAIGDNYKMHELCKAVNLVSGVRLTMCVREKEWEVVRSEYQELLGDSIEVVHASGKELSKYYDDTDLGVVLVEPFDYREFAFSVKLAEYVSYGKPVAASMGTFNAVVVDTDGLGWSVPYAERAIEQLLERLRDDRNLLKVAQENVLRYRDENSWTQRARQVERSLRAVNRG